MAGQFGDAESARRLGESLRAAGRKISAAADGLSGHVDRLVADSWKGRSPERFRSHWREQALRSRRLAAACEHAGCQLIALAPALDRANQVAAQAPAPSGGGSALGRFGSGDPAAEQRSAGLLGQAADGVHAARVAALGKLAGVALPRFGPPLSVREVQAQSARLAPPRRAREPRRGHQADSMPTVDHVLHLIGGTIVQGGPHNTVDQVGGRWHPGFAAQWLSAHVLPDQGKEQRTGLGRLVWRATQAPYGWHGAGWWYLPGLPLRVQLGLEQGALQAGRSVVDLAPGPDGGLGHWLFGDATAAQSWQGAARLAGSQAGTEASGLATLATSPRSRLGQVARQQFHQNDAIFGSFNRSLVDWNQWKTDPGRAAGNTLFNLGSIVEGPKLLRLKAGAPATTAARTGTAAADTAAEAVKGTRGGATEGAADGGSASRSLQDEKPWQPPGPPPGPFSKPLPEDPPRLLATSTPRGVAGTTDAGAVKGPATSLRNDGDVSTAPAKNIRFSDTKPIESRFKGESRPRWLGGRGVNYLRGAVQREPYRLYVRNGLLYDAQGKLFDSSSGVTFWSGRGRAIFVVDRHGNIYASNYQVPGFFHHSSFLAGRPVAGAGELEVVDGQLRVISDSSGHYLPSRFYTQQTVNYFRSLGIHIDDSQVEVKAPR